MAISILFDTFLQFKMGLFQDQCTCRKSKVVLYLLLHSWKRGYGRLEDCPEAREFNIHLHTLVLPPTLGRSLFAHARQVETVLPCLLQYRLHGLNHKEMLPMRRTGYFTGNKSTVVSSITEPSAPNLRSWLEPYVVHLVVHNA